MSSMFQDRYVSLGFMLAVCAGKHGECQMVHNLQSAAADIILAMDLAYTDVIHF